MWEKLLAALQKFFPHNEDAVPYHAPVGPVEPPKPIVPARRVAVIVGHEAKKEGMTLYTKEGEYSWNKRIAGKLIKAYKGPNEIKLFFRDKVGIEGVAVAVAAWKADTTIELHINASGIETARGCEVLAIDGHAVSVNLAAAIAEKLSKDMSIKKRHGDGVKHLVTNDRGRVALQLCLTKGVRRAVLIEPFFGDFKNDESKVFVENEDMYVECLCGLVDI